MKNFWPHRSDVKGFSIKKLASKYIEKISTVSFDESSNQLLVESNLKTREGDCMHRSISHSPIKKGHWANRDFSEYRDVA